MLSNVFFFKQRTAYEMERAGAFLCECVFALGIGGSKEWDERLLVALSQGFEQLETVDCFGDCGLRIQDDGREDGSGEVEILEGRTLFMADT